MDENIVLEFSVGLILDGQESDFLDPALLGMESSSISELHQWWFLCCSLRAVLNLVTMQYKMSWRYPVFDQWTGTRVALILMPALGSSKWHGAWSFGELTRFAAHEVCYCFKLSGKLSIFMTKSFFPYIVVFSCVSYHVRKLFVEFNLWSVIIAWKYEVLKKGSGLRCIILIEIV